ncbi:MAG TPA: DUF1553 domain-containing protein [Bryobacterales bacterium]|nr:DUF1553 domain-containing protein [Bryobacterales bacterium]
MLLALLLAPVLRAAEAADAREFFELKVRPVLAKNCFACHTSARMGGLEMKSRESLLQGGKDGPVIVPGEPDKSLLIQAVEQTHARLKMPPGGKLKDEEIQDLIAWVKNGAVWPEGGPAITPSVPAITAKQRAYWAFQPVRKPALPAVKDKSWPQAPIDYFILSALEKRGLQPNKPAGKRTLIRRAYFDLIGLPPTPEQIDAFVKDSSRDAFAKVVDRLLASPHYGERWGRHWLDVARYSDDKLNSTKDEPVPNAYRYRDWVIQAFNDDMPYDRFIEAQIAGDLLPAKDRSKLVAGLGFYALSPEFQDDRVDATTRGFLGLTVACAQCHDHKYDPIPTRDFYSLEGVFTSTEYYQYPLASPEVVAAWKDASKKVEDQEAAVDEFAKTQADQLAEILASKTARYLLAAAKITPASEDLDQPTVERWVKYLAKKPKDHPYLQAFEQSPSKEEAEKFEELALAVNREKKEIDEKNLILLGGSKDRRSLTNASLLSLARDKYFLWKDLYSDTGVFYYGKKDIGRYLSGPWKAHLDEMTATLAELKKALPPQYPYLNTIRDIAKPHNVRIAIRGSRDNLGAEAPREFLAVLSDGPPKPFTRGSGRLELAEAIADPQDPLTARVMVNRIWQHHFGRGIVGTPSNFGELGERPSHPELLDYLAARFVENHWSIKAMHREILLSAAYALSAEPSAKNAAVDPDNRLLWRANRRRLEVEALRDAMLAVAGDADLKMGAAPEPLSAENHRRAVYGFVSRKKLHGTLALFDFPNPNATSEQRIVTNVPLQSLFFLNSDFVMQQAEALAERLDKDAGSSDKAKIREAYRLLFGRDPTADETRLGLSFVRSTEAAAAAQDAPPPSRPQGAAPALLLVAADRSPAPAAPVNRDVPAKPETPDAGSASHGPTVKSEALGAVLASHARTAKPEIAEAPASRSRAVTPEAAGTTPATRAQAATPSAPAAAPAARREVAWAQYMQVLLSSNEFQFVN